MLVAALPSMIDKSVADRISVASVTAVAGTVDVPVIECLVEKAVAAGVGVLDAADSETVPLINRPEVTDTI